MTEVWVLLTVVAVAVVGLGLYFRPRKPMPMLFADAREEQLTLQVARSVGCSPAEALPAVRREIDLAPNQSDDTLAKRAAYHYRQNQPVTTCRVYRDTAPG